MIVKHIYKVGAYLSFEFILYKLRIIKTHSITSLRHVAKWTEKHANIDQNKG